MKRRVSEIDCSFGFLTEQLKAVHRDLLQFQAVTEQRFEQMDRRLDKMDGGVDKMGGRLDKMNCRLDHIDSGLRDLRVDMPKIVGDAVRDVMGGKPRKK